MYGILILIVIVLILCNRNNIENFTSNNFLYQRAIEFNYPIRINKNSDNIFYLIEEKILNNCVLVETGNYLKLAKC